MRSITDTQLQCNFRKYSAFYDMLYRDKDYAAEADYVARAIRRLRPTAHSLLELGSGTGRHGSFLAGMGFDVHGIERSPEMVALARATNCRPSSEITGSFTCQVGDICQANLGRRFDAVISLFHVMSYQTTNETLQAAFHVAADHLSSGGLFLFDVWHGPAVLSQGPSDRVKEVEDERYRIKRTAYSQLDVNRSIVKVLFEMDCEDRFTGENFRFSEEHLMRYLFPTEVYLLARNCGFKQIATEEFLTSAPPSPSTWGVTYVLQR
jgi:SAM-dependent methyltransferase